MINLSTLVMMPPVRCLLQALPHLVVHLHQLPVTMEVVFSPGSCSLVDRAPSSLPPMVQVFLQFYQLQLFWFLSISSCLCSFDILYQMIFTIFFAVLTLLCHCLVCWFALFPCVHLLEVRLILCFVGFIIWADVQIFVLFMPVICFLKLLLRSRSVLSE